MTIIVTRYQCEVCGARYKRERSARRCEARGFKPMVKVGDFVTTSKCWGWFDGDVRWIRNPDVELGSFGTVCPNKDSNCFGPCCNYSPLWVVTFIDGDSFDLRHRKVDLHRPRYHLATLAFSKNKGGGYMTGYTFDRGHCSPRRVDPKTLQPSIRAEAKTLLGIEATELL